MTSIFPSFAFNQKGIRQNKSLPLYKEYAYDFEKNTLKKQNSNTYFVTGNEAIKIWIFKALKTKRHKYLAFTHSYGCEIDKLVGTVYDQSILESEAKRYITEALMVNPYIKEIKGFSFKRLSEKLEISFVCVTLYGQLQNTTFLEVV
ncbi:MAG: DUF2634 domain-containing protein [Oscillospiraceae bacterium]